MKLKLMILVLNSIFIFSNSLFSEDNSYNQIVKKANKLFSFKKYNESILLFHKAISFDSTKYEAYYELSKVYLQRGMLDSACYFQERALNYSPYSKREKNLILLKELKQNFAFKIFTDSGEACKKSNKFENAGIYFTQAWRLKPINENLLVDASYCWLKANKFKECFAFLTLLMLSKNKTIVNESEELYIIALATFHKNFGYPIRDSNAFIIILKDFEDLELATKFYYKINNFNINKLRIEFKKNNDILKYYVLCEGNTNKSDLSYELIRIRKIFNSNGLNEFSENIKISGNNFNTKEIEKQKRKINWDIK
jgi:tetratricopeptide (TPR) repeat protein